MSSLSLSPSFRSPMHRAQYNPNVGIHSHPQLGIGGSRHSAAPFGKRVCPSLNSHSSQSHNTSRNWDSHAAAKQRGNSHLKGVLTWRLLEVSPPSFPPSLSFHHLLFSVRLSMGGDCTPSSTSP